MSSAASSRQFELIAGDPSLDLVNTLDWRFRDQTEELLESYGDLTGFLDQSHLLSDRQAHELLRRTGAKAAERVLRESRTLREALAEAIYAGLDGREPASAAVKTMERFFKAARDRQQLVPSESGFRWEFGGLESEPQFPLLLLSRAAADLVLSDRLQEVRACGNPECRWLFLDTSKNHTRRWCDMKICGNRMKARRFKAQHRE
ncbi:MAG TPA: CGNR zinc finger domain-containing protein [Terracidiphilus sp.]|jgi:predicted RNA-binding Zn ribbon-like protein|nr:CGNR zinc finger domain-containing protein [Terracidiphilus sp.]